MASEGNLVQHCENRSSPLKLGTYFEGQANQSTYEDFNTHSKSGFCAKKDSLKEGKPLVSVITVVFNGEVFLEQTILSVINQTYCNVEYIIIDGGSTDNTLGLIKKYEHAIDYWVSEKDNGIYDAMNKGIGHSTGQWINFMNCGDSFYDSSMLKGIFQDECFSGIDIIYGNHNVIYQQGSERLVVAGRLENLWKGSQFCHQASFIRSEYHQNNLFNVKNEIVADFEFFYKAFKEGSKFKFINYVVANYRSGGVSDLHRIVSILGRWMLVDKSFFQSIYYIKLIIEESLKDIAKRFLGLVKKT